jgi:hypothetical protein
VGAYRLFDHPGLLMKSYLGTMPKGTGKPMPFEFYLFFIFARGLHREFPFGYCLGFLFFALQY